MPDSVVKKSNIISEIEKSRISVVVRTCNAQEAIDISKALIEGGLRIIEIIIGYADVYSAIEEISKIEGVSVAAGSVITAQQADCAINAGAKLIVSPVMEMSVLKLCKGIKIPLIIGASTSTEAYNAWKLGVSIIKIFPAHVLGGPEYIKDILTPMPFLHLMPAGGATIDNFTEYLKAGAVAVGMGKAFYAEEKDFKAITKKARLVSTKLDQFIETQRSANK